MDGLVDGLQVLLLGPVAVGREGRVVAVRSARQRALLTVLALHPGRAVGQEQLVHAVWGEDPPAHSRANLQTHAWALRKLLGADAGFEGGGSRAHRLQAAGDGYRLDLDEGQCDVTLALGRQRRAVDLHGAGRVREAVDVLDDALRLWRGNPLQDLDGSLYEDEGPWLRRLHLDLRRSRTQWCAQLGAVGEALCDLDGLVREEPLDEDLRALKIHLLRTSGRRGEALQEFERYRRTVREELGLDPSPAMAQLQLAVLQTPPSPQRRDRELPAVVAAVVPAVRALPRVPDLAAPMSSGRAEKAPRPAGTTSKGFPAVPSGFVGRDEERRAVREALVRDIRGRWSDRPTPVLVTGAGGVGKTSLALRVAADIADEFPDGRVFVDVRGFTDREPLTTSAVLGAVLQGLGRSPGPDDVDTRTTLLAEFLADRRVLIVLDDVPDASVVRRVLPPAGPAAVLVTSRRKLSGLLVRDGGRRTPLGPLTTTDSLALLRRALDVGEFAPGQLEAATELVGLCGRWPLALRIVATRVVELGAPALFSVLTELAATTDPLDFLSTDGDDLGSLDGVLDLSWRALGDEEQRVFADFGRPGNVEMGLPELSRHLDRPVEHVRRTLRRLEEQHLLERVHRDPTQPEAVAGEPRWRVHDALRLLAARHAGGFDPTQRLPA